MNYKITIANKYVNSLEKISMKKHIMSGKNGDKSPIFMFPIEKSYKKGKLHQNANFKTSKINKIVSFMTINLM